MHKRCACSEMKSRILEVLIVNVEGIRHTNLLGTPAYYVITQCGNRVHQSKVSSDNHEVAWWNNKLWFEFPITDWKCLTHLKFRIMDKEFFTDGGFVGETIIYLGGIVAEGINKGILEVKPAPYNVVLEDDTYKGEIKIGLKFITNKAMHQERTTSVAPASQHTQSLCQSIINFVKTSLSRFWCLI